jgi:hypothetical protein
VAKIGNIEQVNTTSGILKVINNGGYVEFMDGPPSTRLCEATRDAAHDETSLG